MTKLYFFLFLIIVFPIAALIAEPYAVDISIFTPSEEAVAAATEGATMTDEKFIYYAFRFSDIEEAQIARYMAKYKQLLSQVAKEIKENNITGELEKGEYILDFLHKNLFTRYKEEETSLGVLFDTGVYNCVSSGIIYYALAHRFGLAVKGVSTTDHAFCSVIIDGKTIDVETTTPHGFNPGEKKEFTDSFGKTGFAYTPPSNYRDRNNMGKQEFLSLIIQNKISALQKRKNFRDTPQYAVKRYALLKTESSYNEMMMEFKNHASYLANKKMHGEAIAFLSKAASLYGQNPILEDTAGKLLYNKIVLLLGRGKIEQVKPKIKEAEDFFNYFKDEKLISAVMLSGAKKILDERKLWAFVSEANFNLSKEEIKKYYNGNFISEKEYKEILMFVYSGELNILMNEKKWTDALIVAEKAVTDTNRDSRAVKLLQTVQYNTGIVYHNKFATLYNKGDKEGALTAIKEGLSLVPGNKTLLSDMRKINTTP